MTERRPLHLLLAEDTDDDEELLLLELRRGGYDVTHERVQTARDMRAALERKRWDLVVSDFVMPEFSAPAAIALVRGMGLDVPIIIVSGTVGEEVAVAAMKSGANDYVLKGSLARLCPTIDRELREAAARADQNRMREQLVISDRMASVGVLAAGVAHEINNPLAALIANLDLSISALSEQVATSPHAKTLDTVHEQLQDAQECAERLRQIVRDLKIFSRASDDEPRAPVNVERVLESSLRMAHNAIRLRAKVMRDYDEVPYVDANEARLGQVFLNLIINAAQAMSEADVDRNQIRVSTRADESGRVAVEIADTGSGIAPENLERIFDAFFTTKPTGIGTGLGLSICHRIITDLGGSITVTSKVGAGTKFRILLPLASAEHASAKWVVKTHAASKRGRVLVIDDEPTIQRVVKRTLANEHDVITVSSAQEGLKRLLAGEHFDVILCDLMMPQMTGIDLHRELTRLLPDDAARMIFVTGGAYTPQARGFLDTVANLSIEKPFNPQQLRATVNERVSMADEADRKAPPPRRVKSA